MVIMTNVQISHIDPLSWDLEPYLYTHEKGVFRVQLQTFY